MKYRDKIKRLGIEGLILNNESNWVNVTISTEEVNEGIRLGNLQESESKKLGLKDNSFKSNDKEKLFNSIAGKQFEFAIRRFGGGTARIVQINEFHDYPDVGQVNARWTADPGYGLVLTKRDQNMVPIILGTGSCPNFKLMGWIIPGYAKQVIYKVHQVRNEECPSEFGFLQEMKDHEACQVNMQMLLPMSVFNKDLIK